MPPLRSDHFSIEEMIELWNKGKILINQEYQRSEVWKPFQKRDLIDSIMKGFFIGILVIWKNKEGKLEILDGQQRIKTIINFVNDKGTNGEGKKFSELSTTEKSEIKGYSIYYVELKSALDEEEVADIFTRLQEGTPLNTPEKVNAFRGEFRNSFMEIFKNNDIFFQKVPNYRFRARFLAAQFLLLELESNYDRTRFPGMRYIDFKRVNEKYKKRVPHRVLKLCNGYIKFLGMFLHDQISAISYRDWVSFYLLASYLHKKQANKEGLGIYFKKFAMEFLRNLTSFSIYDKSPPRGMPLPLYKKYMDYKQSGRKATLPDSIEKRFKIILGEYKRIFPSIRYKDTNRLFNEEQKIRIYFKQRGLCPICGKSLNFNRAQCHHRKEFSKGGQTKIGNAQMVHPSCHEKLHKQMNKR